MRKMREKILWLIAQRKIKTATAMLSNSVGKGAISDEEFKFLNKKILPKYGDFIDLKMYEVSDDKNNDIFGQYGAYYKTDIGGVPMAFIDGQIVKGYAGDSTTGEQIKSIIENKLIGKGLLAREDEIDNDETAMVLPVFGKVDPKTVSLPALTLILGLLDGFNPCAMWILLFLISLLIGMEDKKRMWLLGSVFIFISGVSYFLFMSAWLQLILFIGFIAIIRVGIGLLAMGIGGVNIRDYIKNRKTDGLVCKVSDNKRGQKIFEKIKSIVRRESLWWSLIGILILGFSVNLVELACSAGFPAVFTQVLALQESIGWQRYMYMIGYIFFYMLDDMIVFLIAMFTLQITMVNNKYAKYLNLFSGVLILILGLLLIFKPEWLMFT